MAEKLINIEAEPNEDQATIDLDFSNPVTRTQAGAKEKALEATLAGSEQNSEVLLESFTNGEDSHVNHEVGQKRATKDWEQKRQTLASLAESGDPTFNEVAEGISLSPVQDFEANAVSKEYGKVFAESVALSSVTLPDLIKEAPEVGYAAVDAMEEFSTRSSIVRDVVDQARYNWEEKGLLSKAGSIGATMVPFLTWYARKNALENAKTSSTLPGSNVREQIEFLWSMPVDEMGSALKEAVDEVSKFSDFDGMLFAEAFMQYSSDDAFIDNAFGVVDVASIIPVTKVGQLIKGGTGAVKSASKAAIKHGPNVNKVSNAVGDTVKAATNTVVKQGIDTGVPKTAVDDLGDILPSILNVDSVFDDVKNLSNATVRKLREAAVSRGAIAEIALKNGRSIDTLNQAERLILAEKAVEDIKKVHPSIKDSVIDMDIIKAEDTEISNLDQAVVTFGKQDGTLFATEQSANTWLKRHLQFKDAVVIPHGERFAIQLKKPISNTGLEAIELAADQKTPDRAGGLFRHLYSDGYSISMQALKDRRTVSDGSELLGKIVEEVADPIINLSNKDGKKVEKVLISARDTIHPDGKRKWPTLNEFVEEFHRLNGELPSDSATDSYVAYRQLNDLEYVMRDVSMLRSKARLGVEKWEIPGMEAFEGIRVDDLPFGVDDYFKVVALDSKGKVIKSATNKTTVNNQDFFKRKLEDGWTLVQSFDGSVKLADDKSTTFVLSQAPKRSQIKFGESLGYNPGGHIISKDPFYIKQGTIRVSASGGRDYAGEKTIWNIASEKEGKEIILKLEEARKLKKSGDKDGFAKYIEDNLPEMSLEDWKRIDVNVPFGITRSGSRLVDTGYYKQGRDFDNNLLGSKFNLSGQLDGRFVGQRQDQTVDAIKSELDSVIRVEKADLIRPLEALQIGMRTAVDAKVMNEYVSKSAETFIREFSDIIDVDPNQLKRNPIAFLTNPSFKSGADPQAVAKANKLASVINDFIGTPTEASRKLQAFKESIATTALERFGKNSAITKFVDERLIHTVKDPTTYFRGLAFHTKMGLFNPKQLLLQSQILTQIASIGGLRNTASVVPAYTYSYGLRLSNRPNMLEHAAEMVAKTPGSGFTKEEFLESQRALDESGWDIIGGSVAWRDMYEGPNISRNVVGKTLELGTTPFKKGEHIGRVIAWHVAYKNWKGANKGKALDRTGKEWISMRASDLTANMTRDMNAAWQRGFLSVGTQFWGFQARVFEQMVSPASRLTSVERLRLFSGVSAMYGVPVGLGAGTMVWPVHESVKKYLMESGLDETVEDSPALESIRDGVMSVAMEMATGMDFDTAAFGPAGNPFFKELLANEKPWYEIAGGASASIIADFVSDVKPAIKGLGDAITLDNNSENVFKINESEIIDVLNMLQVASVDNATKLYRALSIGQWISKNDTIMADISVQEAYIAAISGLQPERVTDTFLRFESGKSVREAIKSAQKEARIEFQRARFALDAGDMDNFRYHMANARKAGISGGLTNVQLSKSHDEGFSPETLEESSIDSYNRYVLDYYKRVEQGNKDE